MQKDHLAARKVPEGNLCQLDFKQLLPRNHCADCISMGDENQDRRGGVHSGRRRQTIHLG